MRDLYAHGHRVLNIDLVPSPESPNPEAEIPLVRADVTDFGKTLEALSGGPRCRGWRRSSTWRRFPRPPTPPRTTCSGHEHVHGVLGRGEAGSAPGGVGVERDDPRAAVLTAARLRAGRRSARLPEDELRAVQGPW